MNAFVKKEIRLLLPSAGICCALGMGNLLFKFNNDGSLQYVWEFVLSFVFCGAVAVMLALNSFGAEISAGTFSNLLAQPVSRQKIWDTKILSLAVALAVVGIFWCGCGIYRLVMLGRDPGWSDALAGVGTFGIVIFSGALWTVLLLRQAAAAFWFTVLIPAMIAGGLGAFLPEYSGEFQEGIIVTVLGLYSLAGFFFARWLFFRAQDLQWSGGTITMPEMRGLAWMRSAGERRAWRPRAALWRKEFQLHQSQYVMAFALLVLHLGALAARKFINFNKNSETLFVLEIFWGLWMVMPLLVGCAAVAEERKLGTLGGQLCLPVKGRTQFMVKFLVVLGLSIFLGAVMPLLLEGFRILPSAPHFNLGDNPDWFSKLNPWELDSWLALQTFFQTLPYLVFIGLAALIGLVSFYASSLARNTLQALAPSVLGLLLLMTLGIAAAKLQPFDLTFLWQGPLYFFIGVPLLLGALVWLAAQNSRQLSVDGKSWAINGVKILLMLLVSILATSAVYHRFWEKFTPFEPAHGVTRLSVSDSVKLQVRWDGVNVRLPDGKILEGYEEMRGSGPLPGLLGNKKMTLPAFAGINGSNWLTVGRAYRTWVGIKNDGSLWASGKYKQIFQNGAWRYDWLGEMREPEPLVQYGAETNWSSLVPYGNFLFLVKTDGTLWRWGCTTNFDSRRQPWPGLQTLTPERLGTESNWADVFSAEYNIYFIKNDGSYWFWYVPRNTNGVKALQIAPDLTVSYTGNYASNKLRSAAWISFAQQFKAGVFEDGTFRIWAEEDWKGIRRSEDAPAWKETDLQLDGGTNWLAVAGSGEKIVTLKADGSLWLWNFHYDFGRDLAVADLGRALKEVKPVRLGTHSDWIAIAGRDGNLTALAADGSLWYWPVMSVSEWSNEYEDDSGKVEPLLDISRKPQLLGNVFAITP